VAHETHANQPPAFTSGRSSRSASVPTCNAGTAGQSRNAMTPASTVRAVASVVADLVTP
jgi:hypothetical protein